MEPTKQYLSIQEAMIALTCSRQTILKMIEGGRLKSVDLNQGMRNKDGHAYRKLTRIPIEEIKRLTEKHGAALKMPDQETVR